MRIKDWPQGLPKEPRQVIDWKAEAMQQLAEEIGVKELFMVETEWLYEDGNDGHANLTLHSTEESAQVELWSLADELGVQLEEGDSSFEHNDEVFFINRYEVVD